jgi:hypothetical protein
MFCDDVMISDPALPIVQASVDSLVQLEEALLVPLDGWRIEKSRNYLLDTCRW